MHQSFVSPAPVGPGIVGTLLRGSTTLRGRCWGLNMASKPRKSRLLPARPNEGRTYKWLGHYMTMKDNRMSKYNLAELIVHRHSDELYDRKRPQEVNPLLTHNAPLTLRMCAHGRRQLPAFDFLAHLLLGLDNHVTQTLVDSQKQSMNQNHLSELTVDITIISCNTIPLL